MQPLIDLFDAYLEKHEKLADFIVSFNLVQLLANLMCIFTFLPLKLLYENKHWEIHPATDIACLCSSFAIAFFVLFLIIQFKTTILKKQNGKYFKIYRNLIQKSHFGNSPIVAIILGIGTTIFHLSFCYICITYLPSIDILKLIPIYIVLWELLFISYQAIIDKCCDEEKVKNEATN